jgi:hypothetical protein
MTMSLINIAWLKKGKNEMGKKIYIDEVRWCGKGIQLRSS